MNDEVCSRPSVKPWWRRLLCALRGHAGIYWEGGATWGTKYTCKKCGDTGRLG
jgi:hypothetical protein